jgi:hypothetical protein
MFLYVLYVGIYVHHTCTMKLSQGNWSLQKYEEIMQYN